MNVQEIQGHWDSIRGKVKEKWGELTDDDLRIVDGNVEQLVGTIEQKTGAARRSIEKFIDELVADDSPLHRMKETAVEYGQAAVQSARDGLEHATEQAREGYERAGQVVRERPASSMAVVFGLGFVTGMVLTVLFCSDA